jgi:hypothetical protein
MVGISLPTRGPTIMLLTCLPFQLDTPGRINTFQILQREAQIIIHQIMLPVEQHENLIKKFMFSLGLS